jgi:REP element-mobilizing transposase RayT
MKKFRNQYRIPSARWQEWDYRWPGAYFITICTKDKQLYFGDIYRHKVALSPIGAIADVLWHQIPNHVKHIELGEFVVMPNHVHGILIIPPSVTIETEHMPHADVETGHALSLQEIPGKQRFQNIGKNSISAIVGSYKSAVTKHANRLGFAFQWQTRFHDHIIRSDKSYINISKYIVANPANWEDDKYYSAK